MSQLTFWSEELPANLSVSPVCEKDWMTRVATSCSPILPLLGNIAPNGWLGKTSPVSCHQTEEGILPLYSEGWQNAGMGSPTGFLTLNSCEHTSIQSLSLNEDGVCSLSDVLEIGEVQPQYYLSARACQGILRRAEKRGKKLPEALYQALLDRSTHSAEEEN